MQIQHSDATIAAKSDVLKSAGKRTAAKLTIVNDDRQVQQATRHTIRSREEALRAAMLRTG